MKTFNFFICILLFPVMLTTKTLWNGDNSIYSTGKTYKVGDSLKIIFNEKTVTDYQMAVSDESSKTSTTKGGQGQIINFLPDLNSGDNYKTSQKSTTKNKGTLEKKITAQVQKILDNGNLEISGTHTILINDMSEQVSIQGIVDPKVIKNKTTVYSTDIINPSIAYNSQIIKSDILSSKDYVEIFSTNISQVSGVTQTNISSQYQISDAKKNELIIKYLNKILSILFKK